MGVDLGNWTLKSTKYLFCLILAQLGSRIYGSIDLSSNNLSANEFYNIFTQIKDIDSLRPFIDFVGQRIPEIQVVWLKVFIEKNSTFFWRLCVPLIQPCKFEQQAWVRCCDFGQDNTFSTGSDSGEFALYDIKSCRCLKSIKAHNDVINCLKFSPNQELIAVGSEDGYLSLLSSADLNIISKRNYRDMPITSLSWTNQGSNIVVGYIDGIVAVVDYIADQVTFYEGHESEVSSIITLPNENSLFITGGSDNYVKIWSHVSGLLKKFKYIPDNLLSGAIYMQPVDANHFIVMSVNAVPVLYNLVGDFCAKANFEQAPALKNVVVCPDGNLAIISDSGRTYWADFTHISNDYWQSHIEKVHSLIFSKDGMHALVGAKSKNVLVWSIENIMNKLSLDQVLLLIFWSKLEAEEKIRVMQNNYWQSVFSDVGEALKNSLEELIWKLPV